MCFEKKKDSIFHLFFSWAHPLWGRRRRSPGDTVRRHWAPDRGRGPGSDAASTLSSPGTPSLTQRARQSGNLSKKYLSIHLWPTQLLCESTRAEILNWHIFRRLDIASFHRVSVRVELLAAEVLLCVEVDGVVPPVVWCPSKPGMNVSYLILSLILPQAEHILSYHSSYLRLDAELKKEVGAVTQWPSPQPHQLRDPGDPRL